MDTDGWSEQLVGGDKFGRDADDVTHRRLDPRVQVLFVALYVVGGTDESGLARDDHAPPPPRFVIDEIGLKYDNLVNCCQHGRGLVTADDDIAVHYRMADRTDCG